MFGQEVFGAVQAVWAHVCLRELLSDNEEVRNVPSANRTDGADDRLQRRLRHDIGSQSGRRRGGEAVDQRPAAKPRPCHEQRRKRHHQQQRHPEVAAAATRH